MLIFVLRDVCFVPEETPEQLIHFQAHRIQAVLVDMLIKENTFETDQIYDSDHVLKC